MKFVAAGDGAVGLSEQVQAGGGGGRERVPQSEPGPPGAAGGGAGATALPPAPLRTLSYGHHR